MRETKILAVDPGSREMGVALFKNDELLYYGVKNIRAQQSYLKKEAKAERIINLLIEEYRPEILAINQPRIVQTGAELLGAVTREIKCAAKKEKLITYERASKVVRQFICGQGKATRLEASKRIAARYPELSRYIDRRSKWEELYYGKMFAAIAVGLACYYDRPEGQTPSK
jgi:Holliday junction resolvasome RuvABC endonuclease subunit